jgi:hypothetical protein
MKEVHFIRKIAGLRPFNFMGPKRFAMGVSNAYGVRPVTQNPKTDTEETRGKLGLNSERGEGRCPRRVTRKSRSWQFCGRWKPEHG